MADPDSNGDENAAIQPPIDAEGWCTTRTTEDTEYTFVWTIENFKNVLANTKFGDENKLESTEFTVLVDDSPQKWKLIMYPNGNRAEESGKIGLFLSNCNKKNVVCAFMLAVLDRNNELKKAQKNKREFRSGQSSWGFRFMTHATMKGPEHVQLMPQNKLTIVCKLTIGGSQKINLAGYKRSNNSGKIPKLKENPMRDFEFAFQNKNLSDVKIVCGDRIFDCHRIILSSRSLVFRAMFLHGMAEAQTKRVEIKELQPEVVNTMLKFIYTGKMKIDSTDFPPTKPEELLAAADMYDLENLKLICEEILCKSLEISNCIKMLVLADMHNARNLYEQAMKLVIGNINDLIHSTAWREKLMKNPSLMTEVMEYMANGSEPPKKRARVSSEEAGQLWGELS